jgi:hypothetical protein
MSKTTAPGLTVNDILAIQQLNARFALAFDKCLPNPAVAWANTFTPEGKFTLLDSTGSVQREAEGTKKLIALHDELAKPTIRHWYSNLLIERERRGATLMRCYFISLDTTKLAILRTATYSDTLVKIRGKWKFKSRTVTLDA